MYVTKRVINKENARARARARMYVRFYIIDANEDCM
jgi:hypothetical protein